MPWCAECGARLAHDQRYCVECGARRGTLPAAVAELLSEKAAPAATGIPTGVPVGALRDLDETPWTPARDWLDRLSSLQPRAAAVAGIDLLAYGAAIGSSRGPVDHSGTR